jgi:hypothetical protein
MFKQCKENEQKQQIIIMFRSPRGITVKSCSTVHKTELDLGILMINLYFSKFKGHNSVKNRLIIPKTKLVLDILMINLYIKFHFNMHNQCKENERKLHTAYYWNVSKFIWHNSVKNCSFVLKTELDLDRIPMINLYTIFHLSMCNQYEENERKLLGGPTHTDRQSAAKQYAPPSPPPLLRMGA